MLLALLALHSPSAAQAHSAVYLIESDAGVIHLSDRTQGRPARLLIDLGAAAPRQVATDRKRAIDPLLMRIVLQAADTHAVDARLVHAVIEAESGYAPRAVSPRGAQGLMQLMPATARHYGVTDPFDAAQNIGAGTLHLRHLLDQYDQNLVLALAAYNAGSAAVARHGNAVPPFAETATYVQRIVRRFDAMRGPANTLTPAPRAS